MTNQPDTADKQLEAREAAFEIGQLATRILALAPAAGLHVGIKIEPLGAKTRGMK